MFEVLVVDRENFCTSPALVAVLTQGLSGEYIVRSAAVEPFAGKLLCEKAGDWLTGRGLSVTNHLPRTVTVEDVRDAGLVIVATRADRSAIVTLLPAAQPRIFTLMQAARLARHVSTRLRARARVDAGLLGQSGPERLAAYLDEARGQARGPSKPADDDAPDPHVDRSHHRALTQLAEAARALTDLATQVPTI